MSKHKAQILPLATQIATGTGTVLDMATQIGGTDEFFAGTFMLNVTGVTGTTPTLDAFIQMEMPDGSFSDIVAFAVVTGVAKRVVSLIPAASGAEGPTRDAALAVSSSLDFPLTGKYRAKWRLSGLASPSFTFEVVADLYGSHSGFGPNP